MIMKKIKSNRPEAMETNYYVRDTADEARPEDRIYEQDATREYLPHGYWWDPDFAPDPNAPGM